MQTPNDLTRDPPTANPNIPLVTPNAGNPDAYRDPKSPESIIRNLSQISVQGQADSVFDLDYEKVKQKEGFQNPLSFSLVLLVFILLLFYIYRKKKINRFTFFSLSFLLFVFVFFFEQRFF